MNNNAKVENNTEVTAKERKIMMINFINENGGKARMNMKIADIEAQYNTLKTKANAKEEKEKMYTRKEVDKMIEQALATPMAAIKRMEEMLNKMSEPAKQEAPVEETAPVAEPEENIEFGLRAKYAAICTERTEVYAKWMQALRNRNKDEEKVLEARYNELSNARKDMEADPTFRTRCADLLHGTASATRKYGHKTVDVVADVMHKGVDLTAKGLDKLGNMVDKKDRLNADTIKAPVQVATA